MICFQTVILIQNTVGKRRKDESICPKIIIHIRFFHHFKWLKFVFDVVGFREENPYYIRVKKIAHENLK